MYDGLSNDESNHASPPAKVTPKSQPNPRTSTPKHQNANKKPRQKSLKNKMKRSLRVLVINCRSIVDKKQEYENLIHSTRPDVIIGTESWLKPMDCDDECAPKDQYDIFRKDRINAKGGGVFIATKKDLSAEAEPELDTDCELTWCKISSDGQKTLHIGAFYRPHEKDELSLDELQKSLNRLGETDQNILLAGDFNLPGWDWSENTIRPDKCNHPRLHHKFIDLIGAKGLEQLVTEPTRGMVTLDLAITNNPTRVNSVKVIPGISDHDCVQVELDISPIRNHQAPRDIPLYGKAKWEEFAKQMENAWGEIDSKKDTASANDLWLIFSKAIQEGTKKFIPHKKAKRKDNLPWVTREIQKLIKRKNRLHYKKRSTKNFNRSSQNFRALEKKISETNKIVQKKMRHAYWEYIDSLITPSDTDDNEYSGMKRFWSFIKHRRKDANGVAPLKVNGTTTSTPKGKADILNQQFESVFTHETPIGDDFLPQVSPHKTMEDIHFTTNGIEKLLKNLKVHKAAGPDAITPRILKELSPVVARILTIIYTRSYETGEAPDDWKRANVAPVYKKGNKHDPANYRPISLTCISCKLMEHVIASQIMSHGNSNNILYDLQHGFRSKRSCESQLLELTTELFNNTQNGKQTDALVLDFSKAFDKVGHKRLLRLLRYYGIAGKTNLWIESFLSSRTQQVVVEGEHSYVGNVVSGVPQGSVLGPCLFLFYINSLPEGLLSRARLFADDTLIYMTISSRADGSKLQSDLDALERWEKKWMMEFHPGKCEVLSVSRKRKPTVINYTLHGVALKRVQHAKYLGVTISSDLRWNTHVNNVKAKASRTLGFLRRNLQVKNQAIKTRAYQTLVRPQVEYASAIWDPFTANNTNKLEMVQRTAARYVTNTWYYKASVSELLQTLGWPSLADRREKARLGLFYRMHHGLVAINEQLQYAQPTGRSTRAANTQSYRIPQSTCDYHQNSFFPRTIPVWNSLPNAIVTAESADAFRVALAAHRPPQ